MSSLSNELTWRGFLNQSTFANIKDLDLETRKFYWGVDPSADSMTIGNLAPAMMVRHFIDHGHEAVLLLGGATGLIGDPDGRKQERDLRNEADVSNNSQALARQYSQIFAGKDFEVVNNIDWFKDLGYLDFLREVGKSASMTQMLDREFIKDRIGEGGSGISYAEFSYALIQGYDFLHLYRDKGVTLQIAGGDQWGNSITGVDLLRRLEGVEGHVLTCPLIIDKKTGIKFGKSEAGAIWLDPQKTSPYKFYQFWLNLDDQMSEELIKIYTLLDQDTINNLISRHQTNPGARELQRRLAQEVTDLIHGTERRQSVERVTDVLFGNAEFSQLNSDDIEALASEIPTVKLGTDVITALVETQVCGSNGEARRIIQGNGITVNGQKISENLTITDKSLVKKGKNTFILIK